MAAGDIIVVNENSFGKKGNYYDGTDDYVLHDAHAIARVAAGDTLGTYTVWIYLDSINADQTILSAGDNSSGNEFLQLLSSGGKLRIMLRHSGATQFDVIETTASLEARKWIHVAVVMNGTRPVLYVNGKTTAMTDTTSTDLNAWYNILTLVDKFALGVLESFNTHTNDFTGAIGQVKYWSLALTADEIKTESQEHLSHSTERQTVLDAALQFNVTYEDDGTTDAGLGADNGTLTGNAYYGGIISDWSYTLNANVTGHAAEDMNTIDSGNGKLLTVIKRGD